MAGILSDILSFNVINNKIISFRCSQLRLPLSQLYWQETSRSFISIKVLCSEHVWMFFNCLYFYLYFTSRIMWRVFQFSIPGPTVNWLRAKTSSNPYGYSYRSDYEKFGQSGEISPSGPNQMSLAKINMHPGQTHQSHAPSCTGLNVVGVNEKCKFTSHLGIKIFVNILSVSSM